MRKNPVDVIGCQYRFWALIARHAPKVMMDLFDCGNAMEWHAKLKLPDWCLRFAESALLNPRGGHTRRSRIRKRGARNIRRAAWLWAVYSLVYYFKPPALQLTLRLWSDEETFIAPTLEELKRRALEAFERCIAKEVADYDANSTINGNNSAGSVCN